MTYNDVDVWYGRIFRTVVASVDDESDLPVPWFTYNIWRDLQWTAYVGPCQGHDQCLAFGLNLEKTPTWRLVQKRVESPEFKDIISSLHDIEWRWHGRPRQIMRNPPFEGGGPYAVRPTNQVSVDEWLQELYPILDGSRKWKGGSCHGGLIRPHLQLMRYIAPASIQQSANGVAIAMRATMFELKPVVSLLTGGRR